MFNKFVTFLREVRAEMRKVTWPKQNEVYGTTVVVIVFCFIFGFFLWAVDVVMSRVVTFIYAYFT